MYYRDQYGNVVEYSPAGMYSNAIHPGGVGYHPLTREDFGVQDIKTWFDTYKMWFLYALLVVMILWIVMWMFQGKSKKSNSSVFY